MPVPMPSSSELEAPEVPQLPSDSGGVRTRPVLLSLWLLERLGTGLAFLYLPILIVIQTAAVVSHWCGQQVANQTTQFLIFVLASVMVIELSYLASAGMRKWQSATHPPGSGNSPKDGNDSGHRFQLVTIIYISCLLAFQRYETPSFLILTALTTTAYILWQRWSRPDWRTETGKALQLLALILALKYVGLPILKAIYQPDDTARQRPIPTVDLTRTPASRISEFDHADVFSKHNSPLTFSGESHDPVSFVLHVSLHPHRVNADFRNCGLCPD